MRYHWGLGVGHAYSHASRVRRYTPDVQLRESRDAEPLVEESRPQPTSIGLGEVDAAMLALNDEEEQSDEDEDGDTRELDVPALGPNDMVFRESDEECSDQDEDDDGSRDRGDNDNSDSDDTHE
jgi:hypothetical protein